MGGLFFRNSLTIKKPDLRDDPAFWFNGFGSVLIGRSRGHFSHKSAIWRIRIFFFVSFLELDHIVVVVIGNVHADFVVHRIASVTAWNFVSVFPFAIFLVIIGAFLRIKVGFDIRIVIVTQAALRDWIDQRWRFVGFFTIGLRIGI